MRHGLTMAPAGLLLVLALVGAGPELVPREVAVPDERFGSRTAPILLLTRPDVQIDLHLDPEQVAAARGEIARLLEQALRLKNKRDRGVEEERRRIDDEMSGWLSRTLTEAQLVRLRQVSFQWEGATAMTRPHVIVFLKLSDPQRLAIDRVLKQLVARRQAARGKLMPAEIGQFSAQALAVLSPDQKDLWERSLGPPCRFSIGGQTVTTRIPADPRVVKTRAGSDR